MRQRKPKRQRARRRKRRAALALDRGLRQELALEGARDLLLGRALRRLREGRHYRRLGFARWADYVAERLGCELRWAQYLMRMDRVLDRLPEMREAVASGALSSLQIIHLSRLLTPDMPEAHRRATIAAAAKLTVRQLDNQVRQLLAEDRARTTLAQFEADAVESSAIPNPWDPGPGRWLSFPASARALTLFEAAAEVARRLAGESLPRHTCLEYLVADRFSAIGWSPELDQDARADERVRALLGRRAEDRARVELGSIAGEDAEGGAGPSGLPPPDGANPNGSGTVCHGRNPVRHRRRFQRKVERRARKLLARDLDPDSTSEPHALDQIVQKLEALDHRVRPRLGELLTALDAMAGYRTLGWPSLREYCRESLGLDPSRATRLIRFREGLDRYPALAAGYEAGRLRYLQVLLLQQIVVPETAQLWARWAEETSVCHTREVIDRALSLALMPPVSNPVPPDAPAGASMSAEAGSASAEVPAPAQSEEGGATFAHFGPGAAELPPGVALPPRPGTRQPIVIGVDEEAIPHPNRLQYRFRCFLPGDLADFVLAGLRSCRDERGFALPEGEALAVLAADFLVNLADPEIQRLIERFPALERDGWQCSVPTCTCRVELNEHHIRFLSQGGPDVESNKTSLCFVHHIVLLHGLLAAIAVSGTAPDLLEWRIGLRPGAPPLLLFRGHRRIDPTAELEGRRAAEAPAPRTPRTDSVTTPADPLAA